MNDTTRVVDRTVLISGLLLRGGLMAKMRDPRAGNVGLGPDDAGLGGIRPGQAIGLGPQRR